MNSGNFNNWASTSTLLLLVGMAVLIAACSRSEPSDTPSESCPSKFVATHDKDILAALPTDSGMHGVWDPHSFADVCNYDDWEKKFIEDADIKNSIRLGRFVPIYVHSDGVPLISVRVARQGVSATLSIQETQYVRNRSAEYLFVSHGLLAVSGIEYITGSKDNSVKVMALAAGRWSVQIFELSQPTHPSKKVAMNIPDFVVLVNPESSHTPKYSESVETFR